MMLVFWLRSRLKKFSSDRSIETIIFRGRLWRTTTVFLADSGEIRKKERAWCMRSDFLRIVRVCASFYFSLHLCVCVEKIRWGSQSDKFPMGRLSFFRRSRSRRRRRRRRLVY